MHNSLFIRNLLRRTNRDPMRLDRRDAHRTVARDPRTTPSAGEFELAGDWRVVCRGDSAIGALVVADLEDFLRRMGVAVAQDAPHAIECLVDAALTVRDCRLSCEPGRIKVVGGDLAGLWAGIAWLEWEMRVRRGPFLPRGEMTRRAAWAVQISQGPWGGNYSVPDFSPEYLSDDAFRLYAHYGVNSMMIYGDLLCYVKSEILAELNCPDYEANLAMLRDAARRAARYGVRFSYVVIGPKLRASHPVFLAHPEVRGSGFEVGGDLIHFLCSSSEVTLDFYRETFSRLFAEVPELEGLILIVAAESFYHCQMWPGAKVRCERCYAQPVEELLSHLLDVIRGAVTAAQPRAWVVPWVYAPGGWERPDRQEFIRQLPQGMPIYHQIEKDQWLQKDGYEKNIWDYSIDFQGPSEIMRGVAKVAHQTGHPLLVKTETGIGLEVFQFPYVPALQHLAQKWERVRALEPAGVQQSWLFFGMFGSRAEELGLWAAYRDDMPRDEFLRRMAVRDFGPEAAEAALASWARMSNAVRHIPCICLQTYYVGPSFLGPAHPLVPEKDAPIPDVFHGYLYYLQEAEETFSRKRIEEAKACLVMASLPDTAESVGIRWEGASDGWDIIVREYAAAAAEAEAAWRHLVEAAPLAPTEADRRNLREEALLTELVYRTMKACENTVRFLRARRECERTGDPSFRTAMREVALQEKANALAADHIYEEAPWLDISERRDGQFASCREMIAEKARWIDRFLREG